MASKASHVEFLVGQLGPGVTAKAMFGEYGLYQRGVLFALVCDDRLFLKRTDAGVALLGPHEEAPPYPGAKPLPVVPEDVWEDHALMTRLADATAAELAAKPAPKKRAAKKAPAAKKAAR
ncbi:MAG: TfoX/Sxy family protein [Myxococcaceae bacterium]